MGVCISYVEYRCQMRTYAALKSNRSLHNAPPPYSDLPIITKPKLKRPAALRNQNADKMYKKLFQKPVTGGGESGESTAPPRGSDELARQQTPPAYVAKRKAAEL